jgi:L-amino acid N-acyltransferase YncA
MSTEVTIRKVTPRDAPTIREIYAPYVVDTSITFETDIPTVEEIQKRIATNSLLGWNVAVANGDVVGFSYAAKYRERAAYQWCCETSIYLRPNFHGKGIGSKLYASLFDQLKAKGFVTAYGVITLPNEQSAAFHESMGFKYFATFKNVGFKLGKWHDVGWWEKNLNVPVLNPTPPALG